MKYNFARRLSAFVVIILGVTGAWSADLPETLPAWSDEESHNLLENGGEGIVSIEVTDSLVFVSAIDVVHGNELWAYDPDQDETWLVKDIAPGIAHSNPNRLLPWGDLLYFAAKEKQFGYELFRSDGTAEGTWRIYDVNPGQGTGVGTMLFSIVNNKIYWVGDDSIHGPEVWLSDGTPEGTRILSNIQDNVSASRTVNPMAQFKDMGLFRATTNAQSGELWRTDGTIAGTMHIPVPGMFVSPDNGQIMPLGQYAIFAGETDNEGMELWCTDGTAEGTTLIRDILPGPGHSSPNNMTVFKGRVVFQANSEQFGQELWWTDGTTAGTEMIKDIVSGGANSNPAPFRVSGDQFFFTADDPAHGTELWVSDGTDSGTRIVKDMIPGPQASHPYSITPFKDGVLFSANTLSYGEELWFSDGTENGTRLIQDIHPGTNHSEPYYIKVLDDVAYFSANDGLHGEELWRSDGTTEGTYLLADFYELFFTTPSSSPTRLTSGPEGIVFTARGADGNPGAWFSDGTENGTRAWPKETAEEAGAKWGGFYPVEAGTFSIRETEAGRDSLWFYGNEDDKHFVADIVSENGLQRLGDHLYFCGVDDTHGTELWQVHVSGGEAQRVTDLVPGDGGASPVLLTVWGDKLFLGAANSEAGQELWVWEANQVRMVVDIHAGTEGSMPHSAVALEEAVYFVANDGVHGPEAWVSDGTISGTRMVADINPVQHQDALYPREFTQLGSAVYFSAHDGISGVELWKTQGTEETTHLVRDLYPGSVSSNPENLTVYKDMIYFRGDTPNKGVELCVSDGTVDGTYIKQDFLRGPGSGAVNNLVIYDDQLFFVTASGENGQAVYEPELRWTDGTIYHELQLQPGNKGGYPSELTVANDVLFLSGDGDVFGQELWRLKSTSAAGGYELILVKDILPHKTTRTAIR